MCVATNLADPVVAIIACEGMYIIRKEILNVKEISKFIP